MTALSPRAAAIARRASALYCATHGSGAPLLLIHGLGTNGALFQPLIPALAANHFVMVPDLRGHGHSRRLPADNDSERMAADLAELLDLLRVPSCTVLGYAEGALIAQRLAVVESQRINGLVLVNAVAPNVASVRAQVGRLRAGFTRLLGGAAPAASGSAHTARPRCPTLIIAGAGDSAVLTQARALANWLPNVQLRLTPGAGDTCIRDHAPALLDRLLPWLSAHTGAA